MFLTMSYLQNIIKKPTANTIKNYTIHKTHCNFLISKSYISKNQEHLSSSGKRNISKYTCTPHFLKSYSFNMYM